MLESQLKDTILIIPSMPSFPKESNENLDLGISKPHSIEVDEA